MCICNLSLLNTDWYIDQMKRQAYDSDPLPIKMDEENTGRERGLGHPRCTAQSCRAVYQPR